MLKKLLVIAVLAISGGLFGVQSVNAAPSSQYTAFCHRSNSVSNPYQLVPFSQTFSEVDGQGNNDHSQHTGPIATSPEVAQNLKNNKQNWGDIIPPVTELLPNGLNWTAEGQAIYNKECNYAGEPDLEQPLITFTLSCVEVNGKLQVAVTLTNEGQVSGSAYVNGVEVEVAAGATVIQYVESGSEIEVKIGRQTYTDTLVCEEPATPQVLGATTTTTPPQVVAPVAGVSAGGGSIVTTIAGITVSLGALGYGGFRLRKFNS